MIIETDGAVLGEGEGRDSQRSISAGESQQLRNGVQTGLDRMQAL